MMKFYKTVLGTSHQHRAYDHLATVKALPGIHWLAALVFATALGVSGAALVKLKHVMTDYRVVAGTQTVNYKLNQTPLTDKEYRSILSWFQRLHPEVMFDVPKEGGLKLYVNSGEGHADWLYALAAVQSRDKDIVWDALELCVGRCGGPAASAIIKGFRQKLQRTDS